MKRTLTREMHLYSPGGADHPSHPDRSRRRSERGPHPPLPLHRIIAMLPPITLSDKFLLSKKFMKELSYYPIFTNLIVLILNLMFVFVSQPPVF